MLYRALVREEKGKYTVTLINRSHLMLPRIANCIRCKFLTTQFLTTALGKNALADGR